MRVLLATVSIGACLLFSGVSPPAEADLIGSGRPCCFPFETANDTLDILILMMSDDPPAAQASWLNSRLRSPEFDLETLIAMRAIIIGRCRNDCPEVLSLAGSIIEDRIHEVRRAEESRFRIIETFAIIVATVLGAAAGLIAQVAITRFRAQRSHVHVRAEPALRAKRRRSSVPLRKQQ